MWKAHKTIATSAYRLKLEVFPWSVITMPYIVQESKELIYQGFVSYGGTWNILHMNPIHPSTIMWTYVIHKPQKCVDVP